MYAVGIDSGTQGTKALIVDFSGKVRGRGYAPHRFVKNLKPGESEQDPRVWIQAVNAALAEALASSRIDPRSVVALGVSGQQHGFVPLDAGGRPIRPAKLWNDTSTAAETEEIIAALGGKSACIRKLGLVPAVGFTASKVLWLKRREPQNYDRLATALLPHNYLNFHLTGEAAMEYGDASGTGFMDIRRRRWHPAALAAVDPGLADRLPPLRHPEEPLGYLRKAVASRFGFGRVLVSSGGGDNMMGAIGTGNTAPGVCTLSLGTSGTIYAYFPEPFIDPAGEIAPFCDSTGGWLPLLCTMNVTNTTEAFKSLLKLSNRNLETLAARAPEGSAGLLFLPFIDGERVPVLPHARGVFFGLDRATFGASHMARAIMEGTILNLGYGFARMRALGLEPSEIRATGGGAKSRIWLQIAADIFQTPVAVPAESEAAAFGAALQAIWSYEREKNGESDIAALTARTVRLGKTTIKPRKAFAGLYGELQERFNRLWKTLAPEFRLRD
jgi:xylulokinase